MDGGTTDLCHSPPRELSSPPIPDELLLDIFRRIHIPADLVRTSAACVTFRRLIADRSFLRRFRKLSAPPFLGFLEHARKVFHPAAAPEASAAALVADFSFSFLPAPASDWLVQDVRDGRVLLDRAPQHHIDRKYDVVFPELVVCDPLHRRYLLLPPIPDHLAAMLEQPTGIKRRPHCETFLAPPVVDEASAAEDTSFRVVWMAQCTTKLVALVFSSTTGQWRAISSQRWTNLLRGLVMSTALPLFSCRQYAYGCFYWVVHSRAKLVVLDTRRMEFSVAEPPPKFMGVHGAEISIVEAGEGRLGMFVRPNYTNYLNYSIRRNNWGSSSQWQFERTISLDFQYLVMGSTRKHLLLSVWGSSIGTGCFSLDFKTFELERVFVSDSCMSHGHTYSNFPPSLLSTPTVSCGLEEGAEKVMLEQGCASSSSAQSSQPSE